MIPRYVESSILIIYTLDLLPELLESLNYWMM